MDNPNLILFFFFLILLFVLPYRKTNDSAAKCCKNIKTLKAVYSSVVKLEHVIKC